jgi:membrane associated rhomboid family serine protease
MRYNTRSRTTSFFASSYLPDGVKWLLISNVAIFLLVFLGGVLGFDARVVYYTFGLRPLDVLHGAIWQLGTYLFIHAGIMHLLFNMFTLWMFGVSLESDWGTRKFLKYYFLCGVGAGLCDVVVNSLIGRNPTTVGASGAIYGLLLAFGVLYAEQTILFSFLFPIKAKYFVMIYAAIEFLMALSSSGSGVSNIAHLGGMAFGLVYLKVRLPQFGLEGFRRQYRQWKMERARKRFQVYMRKHDRDRWTN